MNFQTHLETPNIGPENPFGTKSFAVNKLNCFLDTIDILKKVLEFCYGSGAMVTLLASKLIGV